MWAWMGALGVSTHEGIVSPAYGVYRFTDPDMEPLYFDALFRSRAYVAEMTRYEGRLDLTAPALPRVVPRAKEPGAAPR